MHMHNQWFSKLSRTKYKSAFVKAMQFVLFYKTVTMSLCDKKNHGK